ncbi:PREDICTED: coiled-coil domain-containing protein 68 [Dipodomys ordii]|uniref:Coiled-coil domain-containing protein 68 n=1 Tax=Dipodomys ordii TaxID=10020 RepID=A0A1S3FCY7_DIPOR|nr:PREDICTED: coiled-coil domain-containing protein 68 [Dipodomys ordii]
MTTVKVTTEALPTSILEDNAAVYEATSAHIIEETEYVRKIRTTLEKIRNQMFKDEIGHNSTNHKLEAKHIGRCRTRQDTWQPHFPVTDKGVNLLGSLGYCSGRGLRHSSLFPVHGLNCELLLSFQWQDHRHCSVTRESTLGDDTEEQNAVMATLSSLLGLGGPEGGHMIPELIEPQVTKLEKEQTLKQHVESLNQVAEKLEEKHKQITELETLVQRMETEKRTLLERKLSLESKLLQLKSNATYANSCQDLQMEISILQEQISHLQFVIHSQHQNLRSVIQEMEGLKNNLKEQDKRIERLQEKVSVLEAQNKELKTKVALWPEMPRTKASKSVSTSELKTEDTSPYLMLIRLRK